MLKIKKNYLVVSMVSVLFLAGCAKENSSTSDSNSTLNGLQSGQPFVPPTTGAGQNPGDSNQFGGVAPLSIDNLNIMSLYTGHPMNDPQNIRINLNMMKTSGGTFGGVATISYVEHGQTYRGYFTAGSTAEATQYNVAFSYGGQQVWHGVFEDYLGGLVVVIDQVTTSSDPTARTVGGSVWFRNFIKTYAPHPPTYCWFVSLGPYDCRPWPYKDKMSTYVDKNPTYGYTRLGTFLGMNQQLAFNGETLL